MTRGKHEKKHVAGASNQPKFRWGGRFVLVAFAAVALLFACGLYDSSRLIVVRQEVLIPRLPPALDGFTILQLSDLHGKRFGQGQAKLLELVNGLSYDVLALTGDMVGDDGDASALMEVLDGVEDKGCVVFVNGKDSEAYDSRTGDMNSIGQRLVTEGCTLLSRPLKVVIRGQTVWLSDLYSETELDRQIRQVQSRTAGNPDQQAKSIRELQHLNDVKRLIQTAASDDVKLAITHVPASLSYLKSVQDPAPHYDIIVAGHNHGGQIRLPLVGALFVPNRSMGIDGWFPPQSLVSGLSVFGEQRQYVSRGLGATTSVPHLGFRLFNPPEVNLIVLRMKNQ